MNDKQPVIAWSLWRNNGGTYKHDYRRVMIYGAFLVIGEKEPGKPTRYYRSGQGTHEGARANALYITENLEKDGFTLRQEPVAVLPRMRKTSVFAVLDKLVLLGDAPDEDWEALWVAVVKTGVPLEESTA